MHVQYNPGMSSSASNSIVSADLAALDRDALVDQVQVLTQQVNALQHQIDWFKRQLFGAKSERRLPEPDPRQLYLGQMLDVPASPPPVPTKPVSAHGRRSPRRDPAASAESLPFFDETRVPVVEITLSTPEIEALSPDQYSVIGEKITYRLAQRPASYEVIRYTRPVIKRHDTGALISVPAPIGVIENSRAEVSFCAGLLVDKFAWHLPLYRIHQRLRDAGITVSRPWLTQLAQQAIALLAPIHAAQLESIRSSRVIAMDETPIKASPDGKGKMKQGYFWPVYGEQDEVCFPFSTSRAHGMVLETLGLTPVEGRVLLSDGYAAYERYAAQTNIAHAQCWAHARRKFFEAQQDDPQGSAAALEQIGTLYGIEEAIRERKLAGESKRQHRLTHSKPRVELLFEWIDLQLQRNGLLPSNPFTKALVYTKERQVGLSVFLADPDVPIDTNHLERTLRPIPMGRKNWLFCWTEFGAEQVGVVQSLITTCRLHGVDPYTYLVDVLQRVGEHPASQVAQLTPRVWKQHFAEAPLRSALWGSRG